MLAIRLQRVGRTGHAQFRLIVQDKRAHPKSGRVVAYVGSYNPHTKVATVDKDKISGYLANGATPSDRAAKLLTHEGVKLPDWFKPSAPKKKSVRNPDKRRSTRPAGVPESEKSAPTEEEAPVEEVEPTEAAAVKEEAGTESEKSAEAPESKTEKSNKTEPEKTVETKTTEEKAAEK